MVSVYQKTREGCGCFRGLCRSSAGKFRENSGKTAGKIFPKREMLQILGFRAPGKANLPETLGPHCRDLVPTFRVGCFLKSTVPAFSSFSELNQGVSKQRVTTFAWQPGWQHDVALIAYWQAIVACNLVVLQQAEDVAFVRLGACTMTTKFLTTKVTHFKILLSWRFPKKSSARFWKMFISGPLSPAPLRKKNSCFYCRLAVALLCLYGCQSGRDNSGLRKRVVYKTGTKVQKTERRCQKPERGYEKRNDGTKTRTRAHSPKPPFFRTRQIGANPEKSDLVNLRGPD